MTSPADICRDVRGELEAFHLGQLGESDAARVRDHVRDCPACAAEFEEVRALFSLAGKIETVEPSASFRRAMAGFIESEVSPRPQADRGTVAAVLALFAFAGARFKASRRFRVVTLSAAAHAIVLAVLTLFVLPGVEDDPDPLIVFRDPGKLGELRDDLAEDEPGIPDRVPEDEVAKLPDLLPLPTDDRPRVKPPSDDDLMQPVRPGRRFPTPMVAGLMMDRIDEDRRTTRLRDAGRDERVPAAVKAGLAALVRTQRPDGSWSCGKHYAGYEEGVTGLALLALLANGESVQRGKHRQTVSRAVAWLHDRQQPDGMIGDPAFDRPMYGHAIATLALVEVYGLDYEFLTGGRSHLRRRLRRAIEWTVSAQKADGGWRYLARRDEDDRSPGDTSVTIWQVLALGAAEEAGLHVPGEVMRRARTFLVERTRRVDGVVGYQEEPGATEKVDLTMTAGALAAAPWLGGDAGLTKLRMRAVGASLPSSSDVTDPLLWFYATLGLHLSGDRAFATWATFTTRALLERQLADGSWAPEVKHGQQGGATYATAMGVLILSVDYRDSRRP
jgi:hypothetical protein